MTNLNNSTTPPALPDINYVFDLGQSIDLTQLDFKSRGNEGNHIVMTSNPSENALFRATFMVDTANFYLSADGSLGTRFCSAPHKAKVSCMVGPIPDTIDYAEFKEAIERYPQVASNIEAIVNTFTPKDLDDDDKLLSILHETSLRGHRSVKLTHNLFIRKDQTNEPEEYSLAAWPVSKRNRHDLETLEDKGTHRVAPIPIFETVNGALVKIAPEDYGTLKSCIVEVTFSIVYWDVVDSDTNTRGVSFNALIGSIEILKRPISPISTFRERAYCAMSTGGRKPRRVRSDNVENTSVKENQKDEGSTGSHGKNPGGSRRR